jgi:hypothetical protein
MALEWGADVIKDGNTWVRHGEYQERCDEAFDKLQRVNAFRSFDSKNPTVVCVEKNEARILPAFFNHYRSLGVSVFHIIDNNSDDNSLDIALQNPDVTVWRVDESYRDAAYGQLWVAALVRRFGLGHWVLNVE